MTGLNERRRRPAHEQRININFDRKLLFNMLKIICIWIIIVVMYWDFRYLMPKDTSRVLKMAENVRCRKKSLHKINIQNVFFSLVREKLLTPKHCSAVIILVSQSVSKRVFFAAAHTAVSCVPLVFHTIYLSCTNSDNSMHSMSTSSFSLFIFSTFHFHHLHDFLIT